MLGGLSRLWRGTPEFTLPGRTLQVVMLQTNVAQDQKFAVDRLPEALDWVVPENPELDRSQTRSLPVSTWAGPRAAARSVSRVIGAAFVVESDAE